MNVGELIETLTEYPPDTRVVVDGYEGGYEDVSRKRLEKITLALHVHNIPDIYGPHGRIYTPSEAYVEGWPDAIESGCSTLRGPLDRSKVARALLISRDA